MPRRHPNWVRVCAAVDGFRMRYGHWPSSVLIRRGMIENLRNDTFTGEDFAAINGKVSLIPDDGDGAGVIAKDDSGASYDYGREGFPKVKPIPSAYEWFGVTPKP